MNFTFSFDYLKKDFVFVYVDGLSQDFSFLNEQEVQLEDAPAAGTFVVIQRVTSTTDVVDYVDGSILSADDLDLATLQSRHIAEEARDAAQNIAILQPDGVIDFSGRRVTGVLDPEEDSDVATRGWVETGVDSALVRAQGYANDANTSLAQAKAAASAAAQSQYQAGVWRGQASTFATNAAASADSASEDAVTATSKAQIAVSASGVAVEARNAAKGYSEAAQEAAEEAATSRTQAGAWRGQAAGFAEDAEQSAERAAASAARIDLPTLHKGVEPWSGGGHPSEMALGYDLQITYPDEEAHLLGSPIWVQRKSNISGLTGQSALAISAVGEIMEGATSTHSVIRAYNRNYGTDNDATAFMGRTANHSVGGMSCGTFGAASVNVEGTKATMGMEAHIYVSGPSTTPRDATGDDWFSGQHVMASGDTGAAHHGVYIGSGGTADNKYGFWNGVTIGGHAFSQLGVSGLNIPGTVGLNMAWVNGGAELGIKLGNVGKYHFARPDGGDIKTQAKEFQVISEVGQAAMVVKPQVSSFGRFMIMPDDGVSRLSIAWDSAASGYSYMRAGVGVGLRFNTNGSPTDRLRIEADGNIKMPTLPTSIEGLAVGTLWNDAGTLKVVA